MGKWHHFSLGKPKKSLKDMNKELQKLEQKAKDEQERAVMQKRIYELQHARRIEAINKFKNFASKLEQTATSPKTREFIRKAKKFKVEW